jgi:hydroxyquinol 1,2-dioxygenase
MYVTEETITRIAEERWKTAKNPRLVQLFSALVRHIHAFAREVELTEAEWLTAMDWLTRTGQISSEKRMEFILASDVLGLSMLVVQMNNRFESAATPATVLGPFHIPDSPPMEYGADMSEGIAGEVLYVHGKVTDTQGKPIPNAILDVWQSDADGNYESQIEGVDEARLRALYRTREDGTYCLRTIAPLGYTIPMDGPVGEMIGTTKISHFRPAHIHFMFNVPGYKPLITHIFRAGTEYLENDVVFGVKERLITPFVQHAAGEKTPLGEKSATPFEVVTYDFVLEPKP